MSISEPIKLVQEAHVPDRGHFLAFSDGSAEIIFLDGVKVHTMWKMSSNAQAQVNDERCPLPVQTQFFYMFSA